MKFSMVILLFFSSCAENVFEPAKPLTQKEEGKRALQNNKLGDAQEYLEKHCEKEPTDTECPPLLSRLYLKLAGVNELSLSISITKSKDTSILKSALTAVQFQSTNADEWLEKAKSSLQSNGRALSTDDHFLLVFADFAKCLFYLKELKDPETQVPSAQRIDQITTENATLFAAQLEVTLLQIAKVESLSDMGKKLKEIADALSSNPETPILEKMVSVLTKNLN